MGFLTDFAHEIAHGKMKSERISGIGVAGWTFQVPPSAPDGANLNTREVLFYRGILLAVWFVQKKKSRG